MLTGVAAEELGPLADTLVPLGRRYSLPGINLRNPEDWALYQQLLTHDLDPPPFPHNTDRLCTKAARQMHIWFDP